MDIEMRLSNLEGLVNSICKKIGLTEFYQKADNDGTRQVVFENANQIDNNSNGIFEISEIIGDNTNAIFELADLLSQTIDNK